MNKLVVIGVLFLFVAGSVIPISGFNLEQSSISTISSDGKTLYVGGSGDGNYTKIQDAIDNASNGDTVFVYNGTYYERLEINKTLYLKGISSNTDEKPIIDGELEGRVINLNADGCIIDGFWVRNSGKKWDTWACIIINKKDCTVKNNLITGQAYTGIYIKPEERADGALIINNTIRNIDIYGILMPLTGEGSDHINISENTISNTPNPLNLNGGGKHSLYRNNVTSNGHGILIVYGSGNKIMENSVSNNNAWGIRLWGVWNSQIERNIVFSNSWSGVDLWYGDGSARHIVKDNVIYSNGKKGIDMERVANCIIVQNDISNNGDSGIDTAMNSVNTIINNNVRNNSKHGINIDGDELDIIGNTCNGNGNAGISIESYKHEKNMIINNTVSYNKHGILLAWAEQNTILNNNISYNEIGVCFKNGRFNRLTGNNIYKNNNGSYIYKSKFNIISKNNYVGNEPLATFLDSYFNFWSKNYWNKPLDSPYKIYGYIWKGRIPWENYDRNPAQEPYDI